MKQRWQKFAFHVKSFPWHRLEFLWVLFFFFFFFQNNADIICSIAVCDFSYTFAYFSLGCINPLLPNISDHILHKLSYIFLKVMSSRMWLTVNSFFSWWSFHLFLKLGASHSYRLKGWVTSTASIAVWFINCISLSLVTVVSCSCKKMLLVPCSQKNETWRSDLKFTSIRYAG